MDKRMILRGIAFFVFVIFIFLGCQEDQVNLITSPKPNNTSLPNNTTLKKTNYSNINKSNYDLEIFAEGLARLMKLEKNREILFTAIHNSDKVESIVEATDFLNLIAKVNSKSGVKKEKFCKAISKILDSHKKMKFDKMIKKLSYGIIDIYFP